MWELPGGGGGGGSTPQLMSSTPLVVLLCLSWGVRNNPHRSRSVIVGIHSLHVLLRRTVLLCYWNGNKIAVLLYYMVYCVQHWLCALYSPASNPLWGGVLFPCKCVAAFPFVGLRITHLNTWPFDRTRAGLTSSTVRTCVGPVLGCLNWAIAMIVFGPFMTEIMAG